MGTLPGFPSTRIRYAGILAAHAKWRPLVVPPPPPEAAATPGADDTCHSLPMHKDTKARPLTHRCGYIPWRVLMRQLGIDVETCPRCGGKMKVIALVQDPQGIARYLRHLGLPAARPLLWGGRVGAPPFPSHALPRWCAAGGAGRLPTRGQSRVLGPPLRRAAFADQPDQPLRSPFSGGEGLVCPERGNPWPGAWVRVGIQPWLAPWDTLGAFGHQAATALITPAVRPHRG